MIPSNYLYILKELLNIDNYNKYRIYIKPNKEDTYINLLYKYLDRLITHYNRSISLEEFTTYCQTESRNDSTISELLTLVSTGTLDSSLLLDSINTIRNSSLAYELAELSLAVAEGKKPVSVLTDFVSKFEDNSVQKREDKFVKLEDAYAINTKPGINWRLGSLNQSLGPLRQGDFGFVFARPESGKTTFLASEITYFAEQVERPIIWFNNEEQGGKVLGRCIQGSLGITREELNAETADVFQAKTRGLLRIVDEASLHKREVEHYIKEYNPALVVFDQIDKIKGFDGDRNDLRLGSIYQWARELAKQYCPVIGVCQADGTGEGKKWLTMDNVSDSKTAKQAEADFILGIGKSHNEGFEYVRHINISKNKLTGKHDKFDVLIKPEIARYLDI